MHHPTTFESHIQQGCEDFHRLASMMKSKGKKGIVETKIALDHSKAILNNVLNKLKHQD